MTVFSFAHLIALFLSVVWCLLGLYPWLGLWVVAGGLGHLDVFVDNLLWCIRS